MLGRLSSVLAFLCWASVVLTILFGLSLPDPGSQPGAYGLWVAVGLMASPFVIAGTILSLLAAMFRRRARRQQAAAAA